MKIAVIGGGWYGCHVANTLKAYGAEVLLVEQRDRLFAEASGNNQYRLHLGLHYPRSALTRHQSRDGFFRFAERYPRFSRPVERNVYVVPKHTSLMDFETYFSVMYSSGIQIEKLPLGDVGFLRTEHLSGALTCQERIVQTDVARSHFETALKGHLRLGETVRHIDNMAGRPELLGMAFDYVVDATWGSLGGAQADHYFEPTVLFYYRHVGDGIFPALTLVDGELWSIYPTDKAGVFTLSSVRHTPLGQFDAKAQAYACLAEVSSAGLAAKRRAMEEEASALFPGFRDQFEYLEPQLSIKCKPIGRADDRSASVTREGNVFRVNSGKIDTIFYAGDAILGAIYGG